MVVGGPIQHGAPPLKRRREQQAQYGQTKKSRDPKRISSHGTTQCEGRAPDRNVDFFFFFFSKTRKWKGAKASQQGANKKRYDNDEDEATSPPPRKRLRTGKAPIDNDPSDSGSESSGAEIPPSDDTPINPKNDGAARYQEAQDAYDNMSPSKNFKQDTALSVVDLLKYKELPSYPWRENLCWLDASLELLYMALNYGDWNSFEDLFNEDANQLPPSLVYCFFLTMKGHLFPTFLGRMVQRGSS